MIKKIGFVSSTDPFMDKAAWSGTTYRVREAIEKAGYEVVWIPYKASRMATNAIKAMYYLRYGWGTKFQYAYAYTRVLARSLDKEKIEEVDAVFFCGMGGLAHYCNISKPIFCLGDGTFRLLKDYYWKGVHPQVAKEIDHFDRIGINASTAEIRASRWAADSVVKDYGKASEHTYVLEFGANIDSIDANPIFPYRGGELQVLFSGVDWQRKGARKAIETIEILNRRGVKAHLLLVGLKEIPERYRDHPYITNIGFLNKNDEQQYRKYIETIRRAHVFLMPTTAECAGIVFSEASAFGIPSYTCLTGGTGSYVRNGINGYALPPDADASDFADTIIGSLNVAEQQRLHEGALRLYKERLNWDAWGRGLRKIIEQETK